MAGRSIAFMSIASMAVVVLAPNGAWAQQSTSINVTEGKETFASVGEVLVKVAAPSVAHENLAIYESARQPSGTKLTPPVIPSAFRGEWNSDIGACGTGSNDSQLIVFARKISFYESDGDVNIVLLHTPRAITVSATYAGEGQVWERTDRLVLSRSGSDLTMTSSDADTEASSFTRHRCHRRTKR